MDACMDAVAFAPPELAVTLRFGRATARARVDSLRRRASFQAFAGSIPGVTERLTRHLPYPRTLRYRLYRRGTQIRATRRTFVRRMVCRCLTNEKR